MICNPEEVTRSYTFTHMDRYTYGWIHPLIDQVNIFLFTHLLISPQVSMEHTCSRHCASLWENSGEQINYSACLQGTYSLEGKSGWELVWSRKLPLRCDSYFYFLPFPSGVWYLSSLTKDWTGAPVSRSRVLTTGPPGKPRGVIFLWIYFLIEV